MALISRSCSRQATILSVSLLLAFASQAQAHFSMLLPASHTAVRGEAVMLTYSWGHPYEHQWMDASPPESLVVLAPDGSHRDLHMEKAEIQLPENRTVRVYRTTFSPRQRGDHVFLLRTAVYWLEEDQSFVQDSVRVVVNVQAQKGWDASPDIQGRAPAAPHWLPLTRPYGLLPGMVFRAQAVLGKEARPLAGAMVEIEKYNHTPPEQLPSDHHITYTAKTDPQGVAGATLPEPGWWSLTVSQAAGRRERNGKSYPLINRATIWVHVDASKQPQTKP